MQSSSKKIRSIFLVSFLFFAQLSVVMYINSTALERFVGAKYTSLFYVFGAMGSIVLLWTLPRIVKKVGLVRTAVSIFMLLTAALLVLGTTSLPMVFIGAFIFYTALTGTVWYCDDLFVAHYTDARTAGHTRGIYLTVINTAIALMPVIAGLLVAKLGLGSVYIVGAVLLSVAFIVTAYGQRNFVDGTYEQTTIAAAWKTIKAAPSLRRVLSINFMLQFFYVWMTIFTPLYMSRVLHFSWGQIGTSFSIMLVAFILLQYNVGKIADAIGEKKLLLTGFTIAGISTIAFALLQYHTHSIVAYTVALFFTRVGICMVEVLAETYFFKQVSDKDESVVSVYRMMYPMAYIIAPLAGWYILTMTSYSSLFVILGLMLLCGTLYTLRLVDIR
jgi:MFS family permease